MDRRATFDGLMTLTLPESLSHGLLVRLVRSSGTIVSFPEIAIVFLDALIMNRGLTSLVVDLGLRSTGRGRA